jgi:diguanylate cyclase (GGDEF)-like protein
MPGGMGSPSPPLIALNLLGTVVHAGGSLVVALLLFFLTRSMRQDYFTLWARAWAFLALAQCCLLVAFILGPIGQPFEVVYFVSEWLFVFFMVAGLRVRAGATPPRWSRAAAMPLTVAIGAAVLLSGRHPDFRFRFIPQALVLALSFAGALGYSVRLRHREGTTPGRRIVTAALAVLTLHSGQYVLAQTRTPGGGAASLADWSVLAPILDLLLQTILAFALITLATEDLHQDIEHANLALRRNRDRRAVNGPADVLTEALNRHAFVAFAAEARGEPAPAPGGSVVVVDLDDRKSINERFGHAAGDKAIRSLARAIRAVVRADDLVYRWGGDEFLVVLPGVAPDEAQRRFARFDEALRGQGALEGGGEVSASWGIAAYSPDQPVGEAVEVADRVLSDHKSARRAREVGESGTA